MQRDLGRAAVVFAALIGLSGVEASAAALHQRNLYNGNADFILDEQNVSCNCQPVSPTNDSSSNVQRRESDWEGLKQDTVYFFGYQFFVIGFLYIMPENVSAWSEDDKKKYSFGKWKNNVIHPVKDQDDHFINYVLHPYWGASYYIRARERQFSTWDAFAYSAALSTFYEYGAEALFEPVSRQDLIVTPVAGSLIGRLVFEKIREGVKRKSEPRNFTDRFLLAATDPLGAANVLADALLGRNAEASVSVDLAPRPGQRAGDYLGLRLAFDW